MYTETLISPMLRMKGNAVVPPKRLPSSRSSSGLSGRTGPETGCDPLRCSDRRIDRTTTDAPREGLAGFRGGEPQLGLEGHV